MIDSGPSTSELGDSKTMAGTKTAEVANTDEKTPDQERLVRLNTNLKKERSRIEDLDLTTLGYEPSEAQALDKFREDFELKIRKSGDNPDNFLQNLQSDGVVIIRNSWYLKARKPLLQSLQLSMKKAVGPYEKALFATRDQIQDQLKRMEINNERNNFAYSELQQALQGQVKGVIFFGKRPNPKSIWHESAHAVQMLNGLSMDTSNGQSRIKRELETSQILLQLKSKGLLKDIPEEGYVDTGRKRPFFGVVSSLPSKDIYQEVNFFQKNEQDYHEILPAEDG